MPSRTRPMMTLVLLPSRCRLRGSSPVAQAAYRRGNAAGFHGGRKPKYGKRERQALRHEERIGGSGN